MSKPIGQVSNEEKEEILELYKKKIALESLMRTINPDNEKIYQKIINDYGNTILLFNDWWSDKANVYKWEGSNWSIDFNTNEISKAN